jgi:hypothetical protein
MRLVTVSPTRVGAVTCVRKAAAAAADDKAGFESRALVKACTAAREADGVGGFRWKACTRRALVSNL